MRTKNNEVYFGSCLNFCHTFSVIIVKIFSIFKGALTNLDVNLIDVFSFREGPGVR